MDLQLANALASAAKKAWDLSLEPGEITIEIPKRKEQGEYATNLAMKLGAYPPQKAADYCAGTGCCARCTIPSKAPKLPDPASSTSR